MRHRYVMYCIFVYVIGIFCSFGCSAAHKTTPFLDESTQRPALRVRVLLEEQRISHIPTFTLTSPSGFVIYDGDNTRRKQRIQHTQMTLSYYNHAFWLRNKRISSQRICIATPDNGPIGYGDNQYAGTMTLRMHNKSVYLINFVDIEEYVFSVLRWEGWPGWPDEVNKTFAIMCRTYVVDKVWHQRKHYKHRIYDIKNTNIHQTYKGLHNFHRMRNAIHATRGIILTYAGNPILAMYDSCCGGVIPAHVSGCDFRKAPYLERTYACRFCRSTKLYTWQRQYSVSRFSQMLSDQIKTSHIHDIVVTKRDRAQVVQEVQIRTNTGWVALSGRTLYRACSDLRSLCFWVRKEGDAIVFDGYGFGHHLGLCQWGTREMVRQGWDYKNILKFFYPSVSFMKLHVSRKGS